MIPHRFIRNRSALRSLCLLLPLFLGTALQSNVPMSLSIQGQMSEGDPAVLVQGDRYLKLTLLSINTTTSAEVPIWTTVTPPTVTFANGVFTYDVPVGSGSGPALADISSWTETDPLYLRMEVSEEDPAVVPDPANATFNEFGLSPLSSVPYALRAGSVVDGSVSRSSLDGSLDTELTNFDSNIGNLSGEVTVLSDNLAALQTQVDGLSGGGSGSSPQLLQALGQQVNSLADITALNEPAFLKELDDPNDDVIPDDTYVISIPEGLVGGDPPETYQFLVDLRLYGQTGLANLVESSGRLSIYDGALGLLMFDADPGTGGGAVDPATIHGQYTFTIDVLGGANPITKTLKLIVEPEGMRYVPPGSFWMGDKNGDGAADETPIEKITISRGLLVDEYEVTFDEFSTGSTSDYAAFQMTWIEAVVWLNEKSLTDGLTPVYFADEALTNVFDAADGTANPVYLDIVASGYRLPTEAEWEYVASAGRIVRYPWGNEEGNLVELHVTFGSQSQSLPLLLNESAQPDRYPPNPFGIYHLADNVAEFVFDVYSATEYSRAGRSSTDPIGPDAPASGSIPRVFRGGSYRTNALDASNGNWYAFRVSDRSTLESQASGSSSVGFRAVRTVLER